MRQLIACLYHRFLLFLSSMAPDNLAKWLSIYAYLKTGALTPSHPSYAKADRVKIDVETKIQTGFFPSMLVQCVTDIDYIDWS